MKVEARQLMHLRIESVTKFYRQSHQPAVQNVSMQIQHGAIFGLLGESGSGKTTLLRLVAGFDPVSDGAIILAGVLVSSGPKKTVVPEKRAIGVVFQETALLPHLTVYQNIAFGLHNFSDVQKKERTNDMLALMYLADISKRYPHEISGGQAQRVAIGRALAPQPSLLLLDEPFSSLDPILSSELSDELRSILQKTKTTTLLVTHDRNQIFAFADQVALLRQGRIQQMGTGETLCFSPVNAYVARYFGKVNLIPVERIGNKWKSAFGDVNSLQRIDINGTSTVSIRPWQLKVTASSKDIKSVGVAGTVDSQRFMGEFRELQIRIENVPDIKKLTVYAAVTSRISNGDAVFVTMDDAVRR